MLIRHQVTKRILRLLICFGLAVRAICDAGMCFGEAGMPSPSGIDHSAMRFRVADNTTISGQPVSKRGCHQGFPLLSATAVIALKNPR
jgi:hypothetical protein